MKKKISGFTNVGASTNNKRFQLILIGVLNRVFFLSRLEIGKKFTSRYFLKKYTFYIFNLWRKYRYPRKKTLPSFDFLIIQCLWVAYVRLHAKCFGTRKNQEPLNTAKVNIKKKKVKKFLFIHICIQKDSWGHFYKLTIFK